MKIMTCNNFWQSGVRGDNLGAAPNPGWYVISPECDKSDNRIYQFPADIADNWVTDNTTLSVRKAQGGAAQIFLLNILYDIW